MKKKQKASMLNAIIAAAALAIGIPSSVTAPPAETQAQLSSSKQQTPSAPVDQARHANFIEAARKRIKKFKNMGNGKNGNRGKSKEEQIAIYNRAQLKRHRKVMARLTAAVYRDHGYYRTKPENNKNWQAAFYFPIPDRFKKV